MRIPDRTRVVELVFCLFSVVFVWWLGRLIYSHPVFQILIFGGYALWLIVSELWPEKSAVQKPDLPVLKPEVQEFPVSSPVMIETVSKGPLPLWVFDKGPSRHVH